MKEPSINTPAPNTLNSLTTTNLRYFFVLLTGLFIIGLLAIVFLWRKAPVNDSVPLTENQIKNILDTGNTKGAEIVNNVIKATEGGTFTSSDKRVNLIFPAGFYSEDLIITYRTVNDNYRTAADKVGPVYELEAHTTDGDRVNNFDKHITIQTTLSGASISAEAGTYFYSEANKKWEKLETTVLPEEDQIVALTNHFTLFTSANSDPNQTANGTGTSTSGAIVDNGDGSPSFTTGSSDVGQPSYWGLLTNGHVDGTALFTGNSKNGIRHNWAYWQADNLSGELEVFATIPTGPFVYDVQDSYYGTVMPLTKKATYTIYHAGGQTDVEVDQSAYEGGVVSLGTYNFNGVGKVYLDDIVVETGVGLKSAIVFDAISFGEELGNIDITKPKIEDVKASAYEGTFTVEAKITDEGSGVGGAYLFFNGQLYEMTGQGDIYSVSVSYTKGMNLNYKILAYDNVGNEQIWDSVKGYITRGTFASDLGIPFWSFYQGKNYRKNAVGPAVPGSSRCHPYCGDPIDTSTGNLFEQNKVIIVGGRPEIDLNISYNSQGGSLSIFGESWTHSYNYHVLTMNNADFEGAFVQMPDGRVLKYTGANFSPQDGNKEILINTGNGYELIQMDKSKVIFNSDGNVTRIEDINGNGLNFEYGEVIKFTTFAQITKIKADGGREITLEYGDNTLVSKVVGSEGKVIEFKYNDVNDLTEFKDARGNATKYEYADHNMTRKVSPEGHDYFSNTFDDQRRVTKQKAGESFVQEISYGEDTATLTDANGSKAEYFYNDEGLLVRHIDEQTGVSSYEYNGDRRLSKETDQNGKAREYKYDANGNLIYAKDPMGYVTRLDYDLNFNKPTYEEYKTSDRKTYWEYDAKGNLIKTTDAYGKTSSNEYNQYGQLIKSIDFNGNPTTYTYTSFGDLETITNAEGGVERQGYDGLGRMVIYTNPRGFSYNYIYDNNDNVREINGPLGYKLKYAYDANNNRVTEIDANGGEIEYVYDSSENLISTKDQNNFVTENSYGVMNELLTVKDPEGRTTEYKYDPEYQLVKINFAKATGQEASYESGYDLAGYKTKDVDALGRVTEYVYDDLYRVIKETKNKSTDPADSDTNVVTELKYSPTNQIIETKDANGNVTKYDYDLLNRLIQKTDAENQTTKYEYDAMGNLKKVTNPRGFSTIYDYDKVNQPIKETDALNGVTQLYYDANGNNIQLIDANGVKTKYEYDELDRKVTEVKNFVAGAESTADKNVTTKYNYDLHGNLTKVTDPLGYTTTFTYDPGHRNTVVTDVYGKTDVISYDKVSNPIEIRDRNSNTQKYVYDPLNRVTKYTNQEGHFESYTYDKVGNATKLVNMRGKTYTMEYDALNRQVTEVNPLSRTRINVYDPNGNTLKFTDENGHTDEYRYDKVNRLVSFTDAEGYITQYKYDQNGNRIEVIDGNNNPTKYSFDELDRLIKEINAENEQTQYGYDKLANRVLEVEADNTNHKFEYDPIYRLVKVVNNYKEGVGASNDVNVETKYVYDANSNLRSSTNALGNPTKFNYDKLNRVTDETNPLGNVWKYGYDNVGNRIQRIDANGFATNYKYYPDYMLGEINYPTFTVSYTYGETNFKRVMGDNLGTTQWQYDDLDQLTIQKDPLGRQISYSYDHVGNLTKLTYPDGRSMAHSYLKNDWLKVSESSDKNKAEYIRDGVGNPTKVTRSNSTVSEISYDKVYRPLSVLDKQIGGGNHLIHNYKYEYNDVGHITKEDADYGWRQPAKVTTNYQYDGLHRMVSSVDNDNNSSKYSYDAVGNRTQMLEEIKNKGTETRNYTYNQANQLLKIAIDSPMPPNVVTYTYKYDKNGNRIDKLIGDQTGVDRGTAYTYDYENRIIEAQDYQGQIVKAQGKDEYTVNELAQTHMAYDGEGRRLVSTYYPGASTPGKRTEYTFDHGDPIVEYNMENSQRNNLYRNSEQEMLFYQEFKSEQAPQGTLYFYHQDGEGNIAAVTKQSGQSDHGYRFDEYGLVMPENGNWLAPHNQYALSQKQFDANTSLYYFGSRHYDPLTGTWMSQDSYRGEISDPKSLHRYMYNYSSPINYVDWYGYEPNQNQIGSTEYWVRWVASEEYKLGPNPTEQQKRELLKTISDQVLSDINKTGDSPLGTNPENYNNTGTEFGRYLYSDTYGSDSANSHYLDSLHFFAAAYYQTGMAGDATYYLGLGKEVDQCYRQKISSCGSPEDLASNRAGADFGKYLDLSSSKSVASQLREWLTSIGKTYSNRNTTTSGCVKDSPRQDKLPETDNKDFKQRVEENKKMNEEAFNKGANGEEGKFSFWDNPWGTINYWLGLWDNVTTEMDTSTSESFR